MSCEIDEAPAIAPEPSLIGEIVEKTSIAVPSLRTRTVSTSTRSPRSSLSLIASSSPGMDMSESTERPIISSPL